MARKRLSQEERRSQIIQVAMALFAEKGFKGATTRSIAKAAGVSEAIIFRHFATKEDLYDAIITHTLEKRRSQWEHESISATAPEDVRSAMVAFARAYIERNRQDPTFIRLMMYSALEDHKFRERFFEIHRSPRLRAIRAAIQAGVDQGRFRKIDPALTARSFLWLLLQYCIQAFIARKTAVDPSQDERMTQNTVDILMDGLALESRTTEE